MAKNASEILKLQDEITREVTGDAAAIATGVFGDNKNHPDMAQVSNQKLDDLYRQKYQTNDRAWLQAEARRDPQQFLDVAKRIGVSMPAPGQPSSVVDPNAFGNAVMANATAGVNPGAALPGAPMGMPGSATALPIPAALPAPPAAPVAPGVAPPPGPAAPPPVILGPNGVPLPPMGLQ
jgi:hypothetical protein